MESSLEWIRKICTNNISPHYKHAGPPSAFKLGVAKITYSPCYKRRKSEQLDTPNRIEDRCTDCNTLLDSLVPYFLAWG